VVELAGSATCPPNLELEVVELTGSTSLGQRKLVRGASASTRRWIHAGKLEGDHRRGGHCHIRASARWPNPPLARSRHRRSRPCCCSTPTMLLLHASRDASPLLRATRDAAPRPRHSHPREMRDAGRRSRRLRERRDVGVEGGG
jgi:hypothetical protein